MFKQHPEYQTMPKYEEQQQQEHIFLEEKQPFMLYEIQINENIHNDHQKDHHFFGIGTTEEEINKKRINYYYLHIFI